jgi:hypothetical protein
LKVEGYEGGGAVTGGMTLAARRPVVCLYVTN